VRNCILSRACVGWCTNDSMACLVAAVWKGSRLLSTQTVLMVLVIVLMVSV